LNETQQITALRINRDDFEPTEFKDVIK